MKQVQGMALAAVCGLLLAACGSVEPVEYVETYEEALCHRQVRCGEFRDEESCVRSRQELRARGVDFLALHDGSIAAGRMRFDAERAEECVDLIRDSACEKSLDEFMQSDACKVFVGQRKEGEGCQVNQDCDYPSFYCAKQDGPPVCGAGTCKRSFGQGEEVPGMNGADTCAPGLSPDEEYVCQPTSNEGETCQNDLRCAVGLYCDLKDEVCKRPGIIGVGCGPGERECLPHLRCFEGSCRQLANVGMSCTVQTVFGTRSSDCKKDLFCDVGEEGTKGICKVRRSAGETCFDYNECQTGLGCEQRAGQENATCQAPVGEGEKCDGANCALGLGCHPTKLTCVRQGKEGEACDETNVIISAVCQQGLQCVEGTCQVWYPGLCRAP